MAKILGNGGMIGTSRFWGDFNPRMNRIEDKNGNRLNIRNGSIPAGNTGVHSIEMANISTIDLQNSEQNLYNTSAANDFSNYPNRIYDRVLGFNAGQIYSEGNTQVGNNTTTVPSVSGQFLAGGPSGVSGDQGNAWFQLPDASTNAGAYYISGTATNQFAGRLVFWYRSGTTFTGDVQLANVLWNTGQSGGSTQAKTAQNGVLSGQKVPDTTTGGTNIINNWNFESNEALAGWETTRSANATSYGSAVSAGFFQVVTGGTAGRFNYVAGPTGTPSASTGVVSANSSKQEGNGFVYAETSGYYSRDIWLRSPVFNFGHGDAFNLVLGMYGAAVGTLRIYYVIEDRDLLDIYPGS